MLVMAFGALALTGSSGAVAATPASDVEQHWDLLEAPLVVAPGLSEVSSGRSATYGGFFDPAPMVWFEAVARIQNAVPGTTWRVTLQNDAGTSLAYLDFQAEDSSFTLKRTALVWPYPFVEDVTVRVASVGVPSGTMTVQKSYLNLHQNGVIKRTLGRLPIATEARHLGSEWTPLENLAHYRHDAAAFDPAPVVQLAAAGKTGPTEWAIDLRLIDDQGQIVAGSGLEVRGPSIVSSAPLALVDGRTYHLEGRVPEGVAGPLTFADLKFSQSTNDDRGLARTVGWYSGVSAPFQATNSTVPAGFVFRAPTTQGAFGTNWTWAGSARTDNAGTGDLVLRDLDTQAELATVSVASAGYIYVEAGVDQGGVTPGALLDTTVSSSSLKATLSMLIGKLTLRDLVPPTVQSFSGDDAVNGVDYFNPAQDNDGNGILDHAAFTAQLLDSSPPISWTIAIAADGAP